MTNYKNRQITNKCINKMNDLEKMLRWINCNKTKIFYSASQYKMVKRILKNVYKNYQIRLNNIEPIEFEQFPHGNEI